MPESMDPSISNKASYTLTVLNGEQANQAFNLEPGQQFIGRSPGNHIQINDPTISSRHAVIQVEADGVWIQDLGSTNGTLVNGQRITNSTWLKPGDKLQIGLTVTCHLIAAPAAHRPSRPQSTNPPGAPSSPPAPIPTTAARQLVIRGGQYQDQIFNLPDGRHSIGSAPTNSIVLIDETLSPQHACITVHEGKVWIEDLGSTHGTFVNGERIMTATQIGAKSLIHLGPVLAMKVRASKAARKSRRRKTQSFKKPRKRRIAIGITAGILGFAALIVGAFFAYQYFTRPEPQAVTYYQAPGPMVELNSSLKTGDEVIREWQMSLIATARDVDGVTRGELVVDGEILAQYENSESGYSDTFSFVPSLVPHELGWHTLVARAYNTQGEMGQSSVLRFKVVDPEPGEVLMSSIQDAEAGDTIHTIAAKEGIDAQTIADANPDLDANAKLPEGETVIVPELIYEPDKHPLPDPSEGFELINDGSDKTIIPKDKIQAPPAPKITNASGGECKNGQITPVTITWEPVTGDIRRYIISYQDLTANGILQAGQTTPNDTDFEGIFRAGAPLTFIVEAEDNTGQRSSQGKYDYSVARCEQDIARAIEDSQEVEITLGDLDLGEKNVGVSDIYCYSRIGPNGLYNRIPTIDGQYMRNLPGLESIYRLSDYIPGLKTVLPRKEKVETALECWGWRGDVLEQVSDFNISQGSEDISGEMMELSSTDGGAMLENKLTPVHQFCGEGTNPNISPPVDLRLSQFGYIKKLWFSVINEDNADYVRFRNCDENQRFWNIEKQQIVSGNNSSAEIGPYHCMVHANSLDGPGMIQACKGGDHNCSDWVCYPEYDRPFDLKINHDLPSPQDINFFIAWVEEQDLHGHYIKWTWILPQLKFDSIRNDIAREFGFEGYRVYYDHYTPNIDLNYTTHFYAEIWTDAPGNLDDRNRTWVEPVINNLSCGQHVRFWVQTIADGMVSPKRLPTVVYKKEPCESISLLEITELEINGKNNDKDEDEDTFEMSRATLEINGVLHDIYNDDHTVKLVSGDKFSFGPPLYYHTTFKVSIAPENPELKLEFKLYDPWESGWWPIKTKTETIRCQGKYESPDKNRRIQIGEIRTKVGQESNPECYLYVETVPLTDSVDPGPFPYQSNEVKR